MPAGPRIVSVVGNRPQLVKAAPLLAALEPAADVVVVDTGQHYDHELSALLYDELELRPPDHRLGVGSGPHGAMTGRMLERIEAVLAPLAPAAVVVYGDTNSTLAGALAAAKLRLPLVHVEAGLRAFDRSLPEELNRLVADRLADLLLCPSAAAVANLAAEGITAGVHVVGDVMVDAARLFAARADGRAGVLAALGLEPGAFVLATVHRDASTRPPALARIVAALSSLPGRVLLPLHPRTRAALTAAGLSFGGGVQVVAPVGYLEFTALLRAARVLVTDSGGAQKEAYLHGVPCVTLRRETEWVETVATGWNVLCGDDADGIRAAVAAAARPELRPPLYGDGHAAERMARLIGDLARTG